MQREPGIRNARMETGFDGMMELCMIARRKENYDLSQVRSVGE